LPLAVALGATCTLNMIGELEDSWVNNCAGGQLAGTCFNSKTVWSAPGFGQKFSPAYGVKNSTVSFTLPVAVAVGTPGRRLSHESALPVAAAAQIEIEVVAAVPAAEAASFATLKQYATNLVGNTPAFLTGLLGITVSATTAVVEAGGGEDDSNMNFILLASPPPPSPLPPPSPPPKPLGVGEMSKVGAVKDYTTFFNSNLDGCYAKMAAPRITADIAAALGFSESLVHVTPLEAATGRPWDNTGAKTCPVATGRRLEAGRRLEECTTARPTSCTCSTGACFMQTRFLIVIRVPQADAAAAAASAAAITTLIAATKAAMYSTAALTTLFPSLLQNAEYRSTIQLSGSSVTTVSSTYAATFYYSSPSPPPPTPVVMPPPPPTPVVVSPSPSPPLSPSPPPPAAMCACDQLINGASVFNTCVKVQGKQRICNGLGLTNQGASLCASDHYLCPSSNVPTTHTSPDLFAGSDSCKDKKGKYRDKKCAKKLQKGKCSKKKIAKNCRATCDLCNQ